MEGLKLSGTHHVVVYVDDVNLFKDNINAQELYSYHQNAGQNHYIQKANKFFEDMGKFKYSIWK
jgi:hypothetical protein